MNRHLIGYSIQVSTRGPMPLGLLLVEKHLPPANLPQKTGIGTEAAASCPYALNAVMWDIPYPCWNADRVSDMAFNASSSMGFPHGPFAGDAGGSLAAAANRGCFSRIGNSICSNAASSTAGAPPSWTWGFGCWV